MNLARFMPEDERPEKAVRNLQGIKGGSFTLTLPRWWLTKQGLKKHSPVVMVEDGSALKLAPKDVHGRKRKAEIDVNSLENPKHLRYAIWTYYMQGADEIVVRSRGILSATAKKQLREVRLDLAGIEIAQEDGHSVVFRLPTGPTGQKLDAMVASMEDLILSILRDAIRSVGEDNLELASAVAGREAEVLRIYRSIIRHVVLCNRDPEVAHASGLADSRDLIIYALLARDLSRSVYHGIYATKHFLSHGKSLGKGEYRKSLRRLGEISMTMHRLAFEAFLEKDFQKSLEVTRLMGQARRLEEAISRKVLRDAVDVGLAVTLLLTARELRRIAGYGVAIADIATNRMLTPQTPRPGASADVSP